MSDVIIVGPAPSSYVRTARITANAKGITHTLEPVDLGSEAHARLHPYKKVPILKHGGLTLFETTAICQYIDDAFEGPALAPKDPKARAVMTQWISCMECYVYDHAIKNYALQYILPRGADGKPDRAVIDAQVPKLKEDFALLDRACADGFIAGKEPSIADFFMAPVIATAKLFPEAAEILAGCRNLMRAFERIEAREDYQAANKM